MRLKAYWPVGALLVLMCVAGMRRAQNITPTDIEPYQEAVRRAWKQAPMVVGDWIGEDTPLPTAAVQLLRPNASLNRRYRNVVTGETLSVLAVHCGDARDMEGHYPPNCYPGNGWVMRRREQRDWMGGKVRGTLYQFADGSFNGPTGLWVAGTFALRGQETAREMKDMRFKSRADGARSYGVAQLQVVMPDTTSEHRRDELIETFFGAYQGMFEAAIGTEASPRSRS